MAALCPAPMAACMLKMSIAEKSFINPSLELLSNDPPRDAMGFASLQELLAG